MKRTSIYVQLDEDWLKDNCRDIDTKLYKRIFSKGIWKMITEISTRSNAYQKCT